MCQGQDLHPNAWWYLAADIIERDSREPEPLDTAGSGSTGASTQGPDRVKGHAVGYGKHASVCREGLTSLLVGACRRAM